MQKAFDDDKGNCDNWRKHIVNLTANSGGNDTIVAVPNGDVTGTGLPTFASAPFAEDVIGAGLQLQLASLAAPPINYTLNITLPGAGDKLYLLGSQAATNVNADAINDTVLVGGAPGTRAVDSRRAS